MIPTPGRTVEYTLTDSDVAAINRRRDDAAQAQAHKQQAGFVVHVGNTAEPGQTFPLVITRVFGEPREGAPVNGQVLLDGNDTLWVTSVTEGNGERQWRPYPRV